MGSYRALINITAGAGETCAEGRQHMTQVENWLQPDRTA